MQDLVNQFHIKSLEQTEENRTNLCKFLTLLLAEKILTRDHQQEVTNNFYRLFILVKRKYIILFSF